MAEDFKKLAKEKKLLFGANETLKGIKLGRVKKAYLSSNCPGAMKMDIQKYAALGRVEVEELRIANDELGTMCKKPFSISVVAVKK